MSGQQGASHDRNPNGLREVSSTVRRHYIFREGGADVDSLVPGTLFAPRTSESSPTAPPVGKPNLRRLQLIHGHVRVGVESRGK